MRKNWSLMAAAGVLALGVVVYAFAPGSAAPEPAAPAAESNSAPAPVRIAALDQPDNSARRTPQDAKEVNLSFASVVKRVAPAVVNVYSRSVVQAAVTPFANDPFFRHFFGFNPRMQKRVEQSLGSGVIVRSDGLILTNDHVIKGGQDIVVALPDKREFKAKVVLADPRLDLAVLKINTKGEKLPVVEFGNSDKLEVGDLVLAIGDPFGVGQTTTMGIVSALARTDVGASNYQFFIQTDAAINPGNSGGALVTTDGKLAGINTAIVSRSGGSVGIGFAIPANLARRVVEGALSGGVKLPWIGADGQAVTDSLANALHLSRPEGVVLKNIYPGGPAAQAGLKSGDVVLSVNGQGVDDMQALNYHVATHRAGEWAHLKIARNGKIWATKVKLALPPESPRRDTTTIGGRNPLTGAKVENLSPAVALDMEMDLFAKGVVIRSTNPNTPSGGYGFQRGDIVRAINGQPVTDVARLRHLLDSAGGHWDLVIDRAGRRLTLSVDG